MKKTGLVCWMFLFCMWFSTGTALPAEGIDCLSQVFLTGKGLLDADGDGFADTPALLIMLPDSPNAHETAVAGDLAARLNLESLAVDFACVRQESDSAGPGLQKIPVLIGSRLGRIKELSRLGMLPMESLEEHQGLVRVFEQDGRSGLAIVAGSDRALLQTGRAFFLRWPYLWDIWGRKEGQTYMSVLGDLGALLEQEGIRGVRIHITSALYDFPALESSFDAVKRLRFNTGEIRELAVRVVFADRGAQQAARSLLATLAEQHRRGERSELLSYAGCRRIAFLLEWEGKRERVDLDRMGFPKRMLTPGYKSPSRARVPEKDFDLLGLLSTGAVYADGDRDRIPARINTRMILASDSAAPEVAQLAARLVLPTAGASFPLIYLDSEIEEPKTLDAPILIGKDNTLVKELIRTARLKPLPLETGQAAVQIVPRAFNKSNAVVVYGEDDPSVGKALEYFSRTFPHFTRFEDGAPGLQDIPDTIHELLEGKKGSGEAYLYDQLKKTVETLRDKNLESFEVKLTLSHPDPGLEEEMRDFLKKNIRSEKIELRTIAMDEEKVIFSRSEEFEWEGDQALELLRQHLSDVDGTTGPVSVSLGLSESPAVRSRLKKQVNDLLRELSLPPGEIEVLSSYKQGFFWLKERVLPRLSGLDGLHAVTIRFAAAGDDFTAPKRFYSDPFRWLQELYPVDEFIARETSLALDRITFEAKDDPEPVYEVTAANAEGDVLFHDVFNPRTLLMPYLQALPEWGEVCVTTGWLTIRAGDETVADTDIRSDLERFWSFYQEDVLKEVYAHILKKTGNRPAFDKQPYFKRLFVELWLSEPDYRLGLDEEVVSSLEALHDELYFDTLDFMRGITEIEPPEGDTIPEDSSRYSAPGNILPMFHPSLEGEKGRVEVTFSDWQARTPQMEVSWQEPGRHQNSRKVVFPKFKPKAVRLPALVFDGREGRLDRVYTTIDLGTEKEYLALLDILDGMERLHARNLIPALEFPGLESLKVRIRFGDLIKEAALPVLPALEQAAAPARSDGARGGTVPTNTIISPEMCLDIVRDLSSLPGIKSYIAGNSYEGRDIPVLEIYTPLGPYVSLPRLAAAKPTLYMSGRQHANEVSSTNYILRFAELLARDPEYRSYAQKVNFVLHPMENPDGAALAFELQKLTPFHSLHAGRYSSLGMDIGYQTGAARPLLPEAKVRAGLNRKWLPDIYLNLHGYPSHEWVQPFSGYAPYLFRDYWIPRGWFAYFRALSLPLYPDLAEAGRDLKDYIIRGMQDRPDIHESNRGFYDRYFRWAARWQPHMNYLELDDGVNLYAKRRSSREERLSDRRRITFAEETPELMDETAQGEWLEFLVEQGLTYLKAHADYLMQTGFVRERIEEEDGERIHISFVRKRPGSRLKEK